MSFSSRLIQLRTKKGWSQYEVSNRLGIKRPRYNAWEQDISKPRADMINKIADLFEVSPDYLLGFDNTLELSNTNEPDKNLKDFKDFVLTNEEITFDGRVLTEEDKEKLLRVVEAMFGHSDNNKK